MLSVKECQNIELEIMQNIHIFCEKHNLKYIMVYGTLLGAVRHEGFIPWDNDMDIAMPRPDFDKFLQLVKNETINDDLYCVHYTTDTKYHYQVIRVCNKNTKVTPSYIREQPDKMGVWVDIFVIDGVWKHPVFHPIQQFKLKFNQWLQVADIYAIPENKGIKSFIKNITHKLFPCKNNKHEFALDKAATKCDYNKQELVGITVERFPVFPMEKNAIENRKLIKFEKYNFYAPDKINEYLTFTYGDYMTLPPEEKRMTHDFNAEYINKE